MQLHDCVLTVFYSGWCCSRRLEDRRRSHRACEASHPESGMFTSVERYLSFKQLQSELIIGFTDLYVLHRTK